MTSLRLSLVFIVIVMSTCTVLAQATVETLPTLEPSTTIFKSNFFSRFYSYFIFASIGAISIASFIWYRVYTRQHQHPYQFLESTEKSVSTLLEEGKNEEAKELLMEALQTIENNPIKFPDKCPSKKGTIWMLKRKINELNELLIDN